MDLEKLLEVIQVQRHDFLNHLQVISGLLQLNKLDRAREYIGQVSVEMALMSKTSRVKIPEVTAALLTGFNEASRYQIKLELAVNSNLADCAVPGPVAGEALEHSLNCVIENMASPEIIKERILEVLFTESDKKYTCRLFCPFFRLTDPLRFEKRLAPVGELLAQYGGGAKIAITNNGIEIFLVLPRRETKIG